jgi:hypothetical protein
MAAEATPGGSTGGRQYGAVRDRLDAVAGLPPRDFCISVVPAALGNRRHPDPGA